MSRCPSPEPRSPAMPTEEKILKYIQMCYPDCPRVKFASSRYILLDQYNHILRVSTGSVLGGTSIPMDEVVCGVILCRIYKYRNALPTYDSDGYDEYGPQNVGFIQEASRMVFEFAETFPTSGIPPLAPPDAPNAEDLVLRRRHIQEAIHIHTKTLWRVASRRFEMGLRRCRDQRIKVLQHEIMMKTVIPCDGQHELAHRHEHQVGCTRPEESADYCTPPRSWRRAE